LIKSKGEFWSETDPKKLQGSFLTGIFAKNRTNPTFLQKDVLIKSSVENNDICLNEQLKIKDFDLEPGVYEKLIQNGGAKMKNICRPNPLT
jgi:hypothetical protein